MREQMRWAKTESSVHQRHHPPLRHMGAEARAQGCTQIVCVYYSVSDYYDYYFQLDVYFPFMPRTHKCSKPLSIKATTLR